MIPVSTLIVDDSPSFLQSAVRFLSMDGRVDVIGLALSGADAVIQVQQLRPDLVLMDLAMPGMNGLEATRAIKAGSNPPSVIILTLHDTPEYRTAAREAQADGFVAKSDFGVKLLPLIESLLRKWSASPEAETMAQSDSASAEEVDFSEHATSSVHAIGGLTPALLLAH